MEHVPSQQYEQEIPEDAPALADWIEEELGDSELATFLREHPEGMELCANGMSVLPRTIFELSEDLLNSNFMEGVNLIELFDQKGNLPHSSVSRVVGNLTHEEKKLFDIQERYNVARQRIALREGEREITETEKALLSFCSRTLSDLREAHGLPPFSVPPSALRFVNDPEFGDIDASAQFNVFDQEMLFSEQSTFLSFADLSHEMTHLYSYAAIRVENGPEQMHTYGYRTGVRVVGDDTSGGKGLFLSGLNEALTEETSNRILASLPSDASEFSDFSRFRLEMRDYLEREQRESLGAHRLRAYWINDLKKQDDHISYSFSYAEERNLMFDLFRKLYKRSPERFAGKTEQEAEEELFLMLQKAMFTGNILPFGRLFNETFGRGKFREYGHLQENDEIARFITDL
jgi:hypothetical protein